MSSSSEIRRIPGRSTTYIRATILVLFLYLFYALFSGILVLALGDPVMRQQTWIVFMGLALLFFLPEALVTYAYFRGANRMDRMRLIGYWLFGAGVLTVLILFAGEKINIFFSFVFILSAWLPGLSVDYFFYLRARHEQAARLNLSDVESPLQATGQGLLGMGCLSIMRLFPVLWFVLLFCVVLPIMNKLSMDAGKLMH